VSYQVLARKWRPQSFEDVLGQQAVTRTLRNALKSGRIAHAFVLAGPRGCGKTTTARILARALCCATGPTPAPCGVCDACVEIAEGRDIDVLEIDAATHTGVDNVREVIIEGLAIAPVRNRYKVFIIDEVHMLSTSSFNALLKSIEEPPPHVIFMMATTELHKIPATVLSRSQVHEFRIIPSKVIAERLKTIAGEEQINIGDDGLRLLARAGEGSMRDALSAFDQVRAFAGDTIAVDDVVAVLGLVGRDLVLDMLDAVEHEDAPAAFALAEQAIERGYDLRLLCRELARAVRDLLILTVDGSRVSDPEIAGEGDRDRLIAMSRRWSREDLLRAFDLLTKAEPEIKDSGQPRFNLEMALLRLMHLRKLVPIADLMAHLRADERASASAGQARSRADGPASASAGQARVRADGSASASAGQAPGTRGTPGTLGTLGTRLRAEGPESASAGQARLRAEGPESASAGQARLRAEGPESASAGQAPGALKDRFLSEIKSGKPTFYNMVVAQAYRIDVTSEGVTFSFQPNQKMLREQAEEARPWLQSLAERIAGRKVPVRSAMVAGAEAPAPPASAPQPSADDRRRHAMADSTVQAILEIFPVEKTTVEDA
jgi:DNA polymerase-3 subunit gamma/tau